MRRLKRIARGAIRRLGYDVHRIPAEEVPKGAPEEATAYTGIEVFPLAMIDLIHRRKGDVFFIQAGAHDGLTYDPMRPFIDEYHLPGILIEPQPKIFAKLVENYRGAKNLIFENVAVAHQDGEVSLYTFAEGSALPEHATQLASFRRDALVHNGHSYEGEVVETRVAAITLSSLLEKHNVERVDILQLDTEGFDFEIIKMIDFTRIKPSIISFESAFLSVPEQQACTRLLSSHGYRLATFHVDTVAVLQSNYREALHAGLEQAMSKKLSPNVKEALPAGLEQAMSKTSAN